jgi:hypothetical protein
MSFRGGLPACTTRALGRAGRTGACRPICHTFLFAVRLPLLGPPLLGPPLLRPPLLGPPLLRPPLLGPPLLRPPLSPPLLRPPLLSPPLPRPLLLKLPLLGLPLLRRPLLVPQLLGPSCCGCRPHSARLPSGVSVVPVLLAATALALMDQDGAARRSQRPLRQLGRHTSVRAPPLPARLPLGVI